jgi:hypothetical protein
MMSGNSDTFLRQAICVVPGVACILAFLMSLTINHKKLRKHHHKSATDAKTRLLPQVVSSDSDATVDIDNTSDAPVPQYQATSTTCSKSSS